MHWHISEDDSGMRLDRFVRRELGGMPQSALERHLRSGRIRVSGSKQKSNYRLQHGDEVSAAESLSKPIDNARLTKVSDADRLFAKRKLAQLEVARSDRWIALNKPSGLAVQGGSATHTHIDKWLHMLGDERPRLVHRLDKDTSGLLLLAQDQQAARELTSAFKERLISKSYLAIICGNPGASGVIDAPLRKWGEQGEQKMYIDPTDGQSAITRYIRLETSGGFSVVALQPITGRTHQLRVHMAHIGTPILGDGKYGGVSAHHSEMSSHLHLHAQFLRLPDGQDLRAEPSEHIMHTLAHLEAESVLPETMPSFDRVKIG